MERLAERKWTSKDNTQPTIVLDNCAHCGGMADYRYNSGEVAIKCRECGIATPYFKLQTQAVGVWNKRVK